MTETNRIEFKRELTRVFRDVEMVESLGSGMNRIMSKYSRDNFEFGDNYVRMIVLYNWIPDEGETENGNVPENVLENDMQLTDRQNDIIHRLRETGQVNVLENVLETSATLADFFNVNERTIRRDLQFLQKHDLILHDGPDKGGRWIVL